MSRRGWILVALASLLAACGSGAPQIGARVLGPTDVIPFRGITVDSPELRQYLAVASGRGDELRIVDLTTDKAVLGPTVVFPLSIPSQPRPTRLAAASLGDGGADLLVASSSGSASIELVLTWSEKNTIVDVYDFAGMPGVGNAPEVLAMTAAPVPGVAGQARVIAALTNGKMAVVTATRQQDGSIALARPAVIRDFGFDAVDLSVYESHAAGTEGLWLFAATGDDLDPSPTSEVFGVAQIEISAAPETWTPTALDARGPTLIVSAAEVAERVTTAEQPDSFQPDAPLRVYAALDPVGCGPEFRMNCGLVTLDPLTRTVATDPSGEMDHRAPMPIPGVPLDIAITTQPANLTNDICNEFWSTTNPDAVPLYPNARLRIAPGTGQRCTSSIAAVTSSSGFVYIYDLGRWGAPNEVSIMRSTSRVRPANVTQSRPVIDPTLDVFPYLAFWNGDGADAVLSLQTTDLGTWFKVWPGYTPTEVFHVGWKIALPQLSSRGAIVGRLSDGGSYLAAQSLIGTGTGGPSWALGPKLADPANGVHVGDIVQLVTTTSTACASGDSGIIPETTVAEVLPPDPVLFPGGAVRLAPLVDANGQPVTACWEVAIAQSADGIPPVAFTIRSSGHLLYGERLGYLGRPEKDVRFTLQWHDESDPSLTPEQRVIVRKLRRFYYPGAEQCTESVPCPNFGDIDPMSPGPMLSFRLGWSTADGRTAPEPLRGEQLEVTTVSGLSPMSRKPVGAGALPIGIAPVDRSTFVRPGDVIRFYVAYQDDQVFVFSPGETLAQSFSIR